MTEFRLQSELRSNTDTVVVHCGDHRLQAGFHEFLDSALQLDKNYDLMVIPGGPQSLSGVEHLPKFHWAAWKWLRFFLKHHPIRRLILIQHQDCAWYKTVVPDRQVRPIQEQDLRRVSHTLSDEFPALRVELFYVRWDADSVITVESIPLTAR